MITATFNLLLCNLVYIDIVIKHVLLIEKAQIATI